MFQAARLEPRTVMQVCCVRRRLASSLPWAVPSEGLHPVGLRITRFPIRERLDTRLSSATCGGMPAPSSPGPAPHHPQPLG